MTQFGERLKVLADLLGKDDQDVALDLDLSKAQMSHYTTGKRKVPSELLQRIIDVYGINPNFLFDENAPLFLQSQEQTKSDKMHYLNFSNDSVVTRSYIPFPVSAGIPINIDCMLDTETITLPSELLGKYAKDEDLYFMRVNGDSMNKLIPHKSLIAIKPIDIQDIQDGDIIVYSDGYSYSVKRFYQDGQRLIFRPESYDSRFTDYIVEDNYEEIRIHGKVVTYIVNLD
ncbi:S24 family peptidase [Lysinibacillus capsici]|uniref:helix-turn-helix domain-containing protein n=1 Tax=Lysinibacillus capsici TaxID=2115968 RepID=UPI002E22DDD2|nr:S24 family peptidase [Lysinibacillus capsici]